MFSLSLPRNWDNARNLGNHILRISWLSQLDEIIGLCFGAETIKRNKTLSCLMNYMFKDSLLQYLSLYLN
jgi:hypothetical protein